MRSFELIIIKACIRVSHTSNCGSQYNHTVAYGDDECGATCRRCGKELLSEKEIQPMSNINMDIRHRSSLRFRCTKQSGQVFPQIQAFQVVVFECHFSSTLSSTIRHFIFSPPASFLPETPAHENEPKNPKSLFLLAATQF